MGGAYAGRDLVLRDARTRSACPAIVTMPWEGPTLVEGAEVPGSRRMVAVAALALWVAVAAGCAAEDPESVPTGTPVPQSPVLLSVAVYGPPQVVTAYAELAARFTTATPGVTVSVRPYGSAALARAALAEEVAAEDVPDAFLADVGDLPALMTAETVQPVAELLGEREVDFGDGFQRTSLEAFSAENALQCLPVDVSPLVVYYNTDLIDLGDLTEPDATPVDPSTGWDLEQFAAAAAQVTGAGARGVYVAPTLEQVAPFLESGGGALVDDVEDPTTLRLGSGSSRSAIEKLLEIVRDPQLTFDEDEIAAVSAVQRFRAGELGMILGFRDLTPRLRAEGGPPFDVMPLPAIGSQVTVGRSAGLCLSATTPHPERTADFLAYVASDEGSALLAETGYVVPPNLAAAHSASFLQPGRAPASAAVFSAGVRDIQPMPAVAAWPAVEKMAGPLLTGLFYEPVIDPLSIRLDALDNASVPLLVREDVS